MTAQELIDFEKDIADCFNRGEIRSPVHLYSGNEENLIQVFEAVRPDDWVCCSWRSHYQCLLKGVPPAELKAEILAGHSLTLCFPKYRIISSAMVGGSLPIAVGLALGIKRSASRDFVHCFMGDMTRETGIAHECIKYATNFDLPVHFYVEDNGVSVCTPTKESWGITRPPVHRMDREIRFFYKQDRYPHAGAGKRVQF